MSSFQSPRAIASGDRFVTFDCGEPSLNEWLRSRALRNETTGASRTFVSIEKVSGSVAGYYCLSASSLALEEVAGRVRRNMPNPIPIILIGRLAVDSRFKGMGLGASLLKDAVVKSIETSRILGARALLVHALNPDAESFYARFGFTPVPSAQKSLFLLMSDAEATVAKA